MKQKIRGSLKKFSASPRKGGTVETAFHYFSNVVPHNIYKYTWSSYVHALQSPQGRRLHPGPQATPLQHGLFPNCRPGTCDLILRTK